MCILVQKQLRTFELSGKKVLKNKYQIGQKQKQFENKTLIFSPKRKSFAICQKVKIFPNIK